MTDDPIENAIELAHLTLHGVQFYGYWWSGECAVEDVDPPSNAVCLN